MTATSAPVAGRREWIGSNARALPCLLSSVDLAVVSLAVSPVRADLQPTCALAKPEPGREQPPFAREAGA